MPCVAKNMKAPESSYIVDEMQNGATNLENKTSSYTVKHALMSQ